jgi:hypothetical protein
VSCVRGLIEFGRVLRIEVSSCIRELVEVIRVLELLRSCEL